MAIDITGYEIVRPPSIPERSRIRLFFGGTILKASRSCIEKLDGAVYVHFLVNRELHRIAVEACRDVSRDTFRWATLGAKKKPREIRCETFSYLIYEMMGWNYGLKYSVEGFEEISENGKKVLIFDLDTAEVRDVVRNGARFDGGVKGENEEKRGRSIELYDSFSIVEVPINVKCLENIPKDVSETGGAE